MQIGWCGMDRIKISEDDPVHMMLKHAEYLESMSTCIEAIAFALKDRDQHQEADKLIHSVREQRFQAMLLRGLIAGW